MKNIITVAALLAAGTAFSNAAELIADWSDFSNLTSGDYTLAVSGSTSVADGVLNVVGAANGTANIDLSGAGLTLNDGFSVSMKVSNVGNFGGVNPYAFMSVASAENSYLALVGTNENAGRFAFNGSVGNITTTATSGALAGLSSADPVLVTATFSAGEILLYVGGDQVASGTFSNTDYNAQTISTLALGSWAGSSSNGRLSEFVHSLSVYDGVLTADEVKALAIPEPSAFGLLAGVGALALVAARRRRSK